MIVGIPKEIKNHEYICGPVADAFGLSLTPIDEVL